MKIFAYQNTMILTDTMLQATATLKISMMTTTMHFTTIIKLRNIGVNIMQDDYFQNMYKFFIFSSAHS